MKKKESNETVNTQKLAICAQQRNLLSILDGNQSHTQEQPHILITSLTTLQSTNHTIIAIRFNLAIV